MTKTGARSVALLGENAILSLSDVLDLLPRGSQSKKSAWLRARGLVRDFDGMEVVIIADVLQALRGEQAPPVLSKPKTKDPWDELPRVTVGRK